MYSPVSAELIVVQKFAYLFVHRQYGHMTLVRRYLVLTGVKRPEN